MRAFHSISEAIEDLLEESVQCWKFGEKMIKRVQILCGAGHLTSDMKQAIDEECDLYITGERILYSIEYAQLNNLNLIVGSHTFTEIFGVRSLVNKIKEKYTDIELFLIKEEHLEAMNVERAHSI